MHRKAAALAVVVLLLASMVIVAYWLTSHRTSSSTARTTAVQAGGAYSLEGVYVVILGTMACPHCRAEKKFFESTMPGVAYFCSIDRSGSSCAKAFSILFSAGVTRGTPTNVLCDNRTGRVKAIVVGDVRSVAAWLKLANSTLGNSTRIPVYYGDKLAGYLELRETSSATELYRLLCINTLEDSIKLG